MISHMGLYSKEQSRGDKSSIIAKRFMLSVSYKGKELSPCPSSIYGRPLLGLIATHLFGDSFA